MAKVRRPRVALGVVTRADGVRVEVKNPTIWKLLNEQQATVQTQQQLLEGLREAIVKLEAERDRARGESLAVHQAIEGSWWGWLGVRLGFIRIANSVTKVEIVERPSAVAIAKSAAVGPSELPPAAVAAS